MWLAFEDGWDMAAAEYNSSMTYKIRCMIHSIVDPIMNMLLLLMFGVVELAWLYGIWKLVILLLG